MKSAAPDHIDLLYKAVGDHHTFASKGIRGLVFVAHADLETAFGKVVQALGEHVTRTYGTAATYACADYAAFAAKVDQGLPRFVEVRLAA